MSSVPAYDARVPASEALREATARAHGELESSEFARRLADGSIGCQTYVDYLRAIAVLVANLRTTLPPTSGLRGPSWISYRGSTVTPATRLYGVIYVLYGSHSGNLSIVEAISRGLGLENGIGTAHLLAR